MTKRIKNEQIVMTTTIEKKSAYTLKDIAKMLNKTEHSIVKTIDIKLFDYVHTEKRHSHDTDELSSDYYFTGDQVIKILMFFYSKKKETETKTYHNKEVHKIINGYKLNITKHLKRIEAYKEEIEAYKQKITMYKVDSYECEKLSNKYNALKRKVREFNKVSETLKGI